MTEPQNGPPTFREFREVRDKGAAEPFWISRILIRPWTVYLSYVAVRLGLTPSQVTTLSALLAVGAGALALWPMRWTYLSAAAWTVAFFVLDHVDGEMARYVASRSPAPEGVRNLAGKYYDRLVHYFQAPTLFAGMATGIAISDGEPLWALVGMVCAVGSSGFPRFTASYDLLVFVARSDGPGDKTFLRAASAFNATELGGKAVWFPRSWSDVRRMARQYVGFPGNLFVISGALVFDGLRMGQASPVAVKAVLIGYALILFGNLLVSTRRYYRLLTAVPE